MENSDLNRQLRRVRELAQQTRFATDDYRLQGHWGRYLCIVVAGFVENGLRTIYSEFAASAASPQVARYVASQLEGVTNPKAQRFLQVAGAFRESWRTDLEHYLESETELRKNAIDSIMANRNLIAHGKDTGITVARVVTYLDQCVEVLTFIERQCSRAGP